MIHFAHKKWQVLLFLAGGLCCAGAAAAAQTWPTGTITIISPFPPGGITDQLCRIVGNGLSKILGQSVIVRDKSGAGGTIAMSFAAQAKPDGYTLVMGGSTPSAVAPAMRDVQYDPVKGFEPIAYVAALPIVLVASESVPAPTLGEFIAYAKTHASQLNCGDYGAGSEGQFACLMFSSKMGVKITNVEYGGAPPVNQALLANRVQFSFATLPTELPLIRAGRIRAYGIASDQRSQSAPEIPTLAEQGLKGITFNTWNALYAPAGTPAPVLKLLRSDVAKVLQQPEVRKLILATGSDMHPISVEQLRKLTSDELEFYRRLGSEYNVHLH